MTDGFDFGIGTIYPFIGKNERDKKMMIHSLGPLWDGNEVWLITAGGVTFAAFPIVYATMFSSLYTPLMLILFALILRGVAFEFRGQIDNARWKIIWDICIFVGSFFPALLFGVAFGNIFSGIPFDQQGIYHGNLFLLLNPYGLLTGLLFVLLFIVHGAIWLGIRTNGQLHHRAIKTAKTTWIILLAVAVIFLISTAYATDLYENYLKYPSLFLVVVFILAGLLGIRFFIKQKSYFKAWFSSAAAIVGATFFGIIGLFPRLYPSSMDPAYDLTAFNSSSSPLTLKIMLIVVIIFIPTVIIYQAWTYKMFSHKLTPEDIGYDS